MKKKLMFIRTSKNRFALEWERGLIELSREEVIRLIEEAINLL